MASWNLAEALLSDLHGVWCAWCLEYIVPPDPMELHHVLGLKAAIRKEFGLLPWVVPVHGAVCHRERLQTYADWAGRKLLESRGVLQPNAFENLCEKSFRLGSMSMCMLMRRSALLEATRNHDIDRARKNLLYALNAASGSGMGMSFVRQLERKPELRSLRGDGEFGGLESEWDTRLHVAIVHANAGNVGVARSAYKDLASEIPRFRAASSVNYAKLVRMTAVVKPQVEAASEAMKMARDSPDPVFHTRTSMLGLAYAFEARRDYSTARDQAEALHLDLADGVASWWHYVQQQFLLGRSILFSHNTLPLGAAGIVGLKALVRAQYGAALLNFPFNPVPDFASPSAEPDITGLTPTQVIRWAVKQHKLDREAMSEMRRDAIFGDPSRFSLDVIQPRGFQAQVLNAIHSGITLQ
ncbi:MAG: hypothetical protein JWN34_3013 [Bryobacterales bacterium]|nr:hypothetical protein [Bryobacterales bacterium]